MREGPHTTLCSPPEPPYVAQNSPYLPGPHHPPALTPPLHIKTPCLNPHPTHKDPRQCQQGRLTQGLLLEVGALQAIAGRRPGEETSLFTGPRPSQAHLPHSCPAEPHLPGSLPHNRKLGKPTEPRQGRPDSCACGPFQHLFLGSYMKRRFIRRRPASESHGNLCFRLL